MTLPLESGRPDALSDRIVVSGVAESRLGALAQSTPAGVLVLTGAGIITLANVQIERQFGYTRDELIGQPIDLLLAEASRAAHTAHRESVVSIPEAGVMCRARQLLGRRRDGTELPIHIRLTALAGEQDTMVLAMVCDRPAPCEMAPTGAPASERHLELERLAAELPVSFINLPVDQVDEAMRDALQRIGEALDLDRCTFFRIQPDGMAVAFVFWYRDDVAPPPKVPTREHCPWVLQTILAGQTMCVTAVDEMPSPDREFYRSLGIRSAMTIPLSVEGHVVGAVGFNRTRYEQSWSPEVEHRLRVFAAAFGSVLARRDSEEALQRALDEVSRLRDHLRAENVYLRIEVRERQSAGNIVGKSNAVRQVLEQIHLVSATDSTVLLLGETGTGKELFATQIHESSARHARTMVRVNCAAIPATLLESELFGREKGAFTGALARQVGRFELADRSTIFLDEIGDLSVDVQVKLLRVLEEHQIERLGNPKPIRIDTRIIAATHRNLEQRIREGTFREDLFYRLNVFPIQVPPLRDRVEDIPMLVWRFVEEFSETFAKRIDTIAPDTLAALQQYAWPGNIRELRNVVERAMITASDRCLTIALPPALSVGRRRTANLADVEREHVRSVLEDTGWRIRGAGGAAERLGLPPTTLETRLTKLGLNRPKPS